MDIRVITTESVAGTPAGVDPAKFAGMAGAGSALLDHGLLEQLANANIRIDTVARLTAPATTDDDPIADLAGINARLAEMVGEALNYAVAPVLVGGNCSHTIGMIAGIQAAFSPTVRLGLLWLDAHGDFNTPATSISGMLGGMPVAVAAGLCWPHWREGAGQQAALPTNRIVMVDVRNLDEAEEALIRATDIEIARFGPAFDIRPVTAAIDRLASECDHLYVHVDADILDESLQPNHPTAEPNGPGLEPVTAILDHAFATGKVCAFAVVSVNAEGEQGAISVASGSHLIMAGLRSWAAAHD